MRTFYNTNFAQPSYFPITRHVGLSTSALNSVYAVQNQPNWCWAACIEMVTKYYGIDVKQDEFAKNYCGIDFLGNANDCPASADVITTYLNQCYATHCIEAASYYGSPDIDDLFNLLNAGVPVIVAYNQGINQVGHAVVVTGLSYIQKRNINEVQSIIVRDPDPNIFNRMLNGRKEYNDPRAFLENIYAWWIPSVSKYNCPVCVH